MKVLAALAHFVLYGSERSVAMLNGYAGTGKTSLIGAVVKALTMQNIKTVLLAPTGRAAMIFSGYAGHPAYTIHRRIYREDSYLADGFSLADNRQAMTFFIVDEASMISNGAGMADGATFGSGRLLDDLIAYVYNGQGCRLILLGDNAQLPPVGQQLSPALDERYLQAYGLDVYSLNLSDVARQAADSGILTNATLLRQVITAAPEGSVPSLRLKGFDDIRAIDGNEMLELLEDCYSRDGAESSIIITRSNRRATQFNMGIRNAILYREEELSGGDLLVVAKNNYYATRDEKSVDFIANGDIVEVKRVRGDVEHLYGLRFVNATIALPDHDNIELDVKIILDSLLSDTPALTRAQSERLYNEVMEEKSGDRRARHRQLKEDPYFNALQVKWAYAVTCHKAQGGQWENVFVDMAAIPPEALATTDFTRWLYTAATRATRHLYLLANPLPSDLPTDE